MGDRKQQSLMVSTLVVRGRRTIDESPYHVACCYSIMVSKPYKCLI